jgi:serine/threonine protein kinase
VKPANFLLKWQPEAQQWRPLLSDFGQSKYLTSASLKAKSFRGSLFWTAPELWSPFLGMAREKYTIKVDVWSLGIVLLQMWFGLDSNDETIQKKVSCFFFSIIRMKLILLFDLIFFFSLILIF